MHSTAFSPTRCPFTTHEFKLRRADTSIAHRRRLWATAPPQRVNLQSGWVSFKWMEVRVGQQLAGQIVEQEAAAEVGITLCEALAGWEALGCP